MSIPRPAECGPRWARSDRAATACSETETWQCLLCVNFAELAPGEAERERRLMERLTLELYCQYEPSLALREPHGPAPTCLDAIRGRLQPRHPQRYTQLAHYVADVRLLFRNVYRYNSVRLATLGTRRYARSPPLLQRPLPAGRQQHLQGRQAAGGVLRRAAAEVAAGVRVLGGGRRAPQQAPAPRPRAARAALVRGAFYCESSF